MNRIYSLTLIFSLIGLCASATTHSIEISGVSYTPNELTTQIGDTVLIDASGTHPTREVSQATWDMDGTTELAGGFGTFTESFMIIIDDAESVYFVCTSHVGLGMKAVINVNPSSLDDLRSSLEVNLGQLPVSDGQLDYTISSESAINATLEVISITGQQVARQRINSTTGSLRLSAKGGVYIALIRSTDGQLLFKRSFSVE